MDLSVRTFICLVCGFVCDRDHNAALNLKQLGEAIPEVKPVEMEALVLVSAKMKLSSLKQEFHRDHL
jgi:hypothetical protein